VGESQNQPFQLSFNRFLRVDFQGSRVTSDGGLILVRELDERLGLSELIGHHLVDSRLLAAAGRRASHAGVFWQQASKDRGAAAAGQVANQERQRIERSEVSPYGQVSAARQVGGEGQTKQVRETAKRAAMRPEGGYVDLNLTQEGSRDMVLRRDRVEIGNSGSEVLKTHTDGCGWRICR